MTAISHTANFSTADALPRILADLACPACGYPYPPDEQRPMTDNRLRIFCDGCGAFITISLSDEQAQTLYQRSSTP